MEPRKLAVAMRFHSSSTSLDADSAHGVATPHREVEVILHRWALTRQEFSRDWRTRCRLQMMAGAAGFRPRKEQQFQGTQAPTFTALSCRQANARPSISADKSAKSGRASTGGWRRTAPTQRPGRTARATEA